MSQEVVEPIKNTTTQLETNDAVAAGAAGAPQGQTPSQEGMGHTSRRESGYDDGNKVQADLNKAAKAAAEEEKKKISDKIKKLQGELIQKGKEMDIKYNAAKGDDKTREDLEDEMEAFSVETNEKIDFLHSQLIASDDEPVIVSLVSGAWNLIKLKFKVIINKMKLDPEVKDAQLNMVEIISKNIEDIQENGGSLDTKYAQNLANLLLSLSKDVSQTPGKDESTSKTKGTPGTGVVDEIKDVVVSPAAEEQAAAVVPAETAVNPAAETAAETAGLLPDPREAGQGGGGISRKPSHPKYINQISENRNKIFKKELEIINSIRHFHRSHTIRKRDRINSILGFKKSRNNRNRNHGNTKRHQHKHRHNNNHKHKSAKHIKK